jgi:hypothetical protein
MRLIRAIAFDLLKEIWERIGPHGELDLHRHYTHGKVYEFVGIITACAFGLVIIIDSTEAFK